MVDPEIRGEHRTRACDGDVAALAGRQHGVVARSQLCELGLGGGAIDHRLETGRLHSLYRGVYAVGHRSLSIEGRWIAAVLACGSDAVLSHQSAAALWRLHAGARARVDVTLPRRVASRHGIHAHHCRMPSDEATVERGIPVTTVPRTLIDLSAVAGRGQVERAFREAERLRLVDTLSLADLVRRYPRRRGIATIKALLADRQIGAMVTRSELEERFLAFLEDFDLPRPEVNVPLQISGRWIEADCVWREPRVVVELDGHASHATGTAFERDRARDRALQAAGWRVLRITWRQLHEESDAIASDLRAVLTPERR